MTDRVNALTVVLDHDIREDDVAALKSAIVMLRGVLTVTAHVTTTADSVARERVRREVRELWDTFWRQFNA